MQMQMIDELKEYFNAYVRAYNRQSKPERIATLILTGAVIGASITHTIIMVLAYV